MRKKYINFQLTAYLLATMFRLITRAIVREIAATKERKISLIMAFIISRNMLEN
jgi:uncharacterized Tic20 family protein